MFKIGEFSKFGQVTVPTLRYYDEIGLLEPEKVDSFTGYRYYSARQLPRLNRILALKDLGLSLAKIISLLDDDLSADQIRGILKLKQAEIQQQLQDERARLTRVEQRLRQIEQEASMPTQEVVIKSIPAQTVAAVRDTITVDKLSQLFGELFGYLGQHQVAPAGPPVGIYYDKEFREEGLDVELAVPAAGKLAAGDRVKVRELPAVEQMACIVHEGGYDTVGSTYSQLMQWVESHNYRIVGPTREVYLTGPESGDPSGYVTEIQFPVEAV